MELTAKYSLMVSSFLSYRDCFSQVVDRACTVSLAPLCELSVTAQSLESIPDLDCSSEQVPHTEHRHVLGSEPQEQNINS